MLIPNFSVDESHDSLSEKWLAFVFSQSYDLIVIEDCRSADQNHSIGSESITIRSFLELAIGPHP